VAISIDFLANVRDLVRGTDQVDDSLSKVSDALDDVARDSQRSAEKMGSEYKDAARDVDQSNQRLERSFDELAAASKKSTSKIGDELDRGTRRGTAAASESVKEFGNEAKQNISETFSSFRGDVTDFGQIAQDTLGGLASSLEGIPQIALVAAGAAGIGLILGAIENGQAETAAWKQSVADLAQAYIDAGSSATPSIDHVVDALKRMATASDGVSLKDLSTGARAAKIDFSDLAQAMTGNEAALKSLWRETDKRIAQLKEEAAVAAQRGDVDLVHKLDDEALATKHLQDQLGAQIGVTKEAALAEKLYAETGAAAMETHAEAIGSYASSVQASLQDAGAAWEDYNNDGTTSLDEYNKHIEDQIAATTAYQENVKTVSKSISDDALNYLLTLGDKAAPILQAYVDAPLDQQSRTAANWDSLGKTSGASYTNALKAGIPSALPGPVITPTVNVEAARGALRRLADGTYTVTVEGRTVAGRKVF
jgi:hypothetical protein